MTRRAPGFVLVEVLIVVACLVGLLSVLVADQRASMQESQDLLRRRRAELAARSALTLATATLEQANANVVTLQDDWATLGDDGDEEFDMGDASFRMQIVDAGSCLNVNTAGDDQLQLLPIDDVMRESLLDWRETGTQPRTDGAKDQYYLGLTTPYNARLGSLQTLDELLLIRGWTAQDLYDTPAEMKQSSMAVEDASGQVIPLASVLTVDSGAPNTRADGSSRLNLGQGRPNQTALVRLGLNPMQAQQIAAGAPYKSFGRLLSAPGLQSDAAQQLLDAVTFSPASRLTGVINPNTAPRAVLMTIPGMASDVADAIVSRQSSGFSTLGDLATVPGLSGDLLAAIADRAAIGSDTWVVRAYGQSGGIGLAFEITIRLTSGRAQVITWNRVPVAGVPSWWQWDAQSSYTTVITTK